MQTTLTIKCHGGIELKVGFFDKDKEIEFDLLNKDGDTLGIIWLSPNQANELISHLSEQIKYIKEPIDFLKGRTA